MKGIKCLYTPEEFKQKSSSEIVKFIQKNNNTAIVGDNLGVDRHIVAYKDFHTLVEYTNNNPYSNRNPLL